jgi:tRNA 2-thiouridine synthesizing protein E
MTAARDKEGFLLDLTQWNESVAAELAAEEGVTLTDAHWEILRLVRSIYATYEVSPVMRVLVKHARRELGECKGNSVYLLRLFPGSPAKLAAKIAGLPRPANCL